MSLRRAVVLVLGGAVAWGALALPAMAHVEVEAQPGQPWAADALVTITAEAESTTAGISKVEVVADPAIPADQVTLVEGPTGWTLGPSALGGFTAAGPTVPTGKPAKVSIRVKQLPNSPQVVFKVLQSYADGKTDRWIELPGPDGKEPENPAPIIKLTAGAASVASPAPANDDKEDTHGSLASTGAADRFLALAGGLLLLIGGTSILAGAGRRLQER
jgi:hypothetical protein